MPTKTWVVGEEVLAADFNTFVQKQVVATFPNTAARDAALPSPDEGMLVYLADVNLYQWWNGTAWQVLGGVIRPDGSIVGARMRVGDVVATTDAAFGVITTYWNPPLGYLLVAMGEPKPGDQSGQIVVPILNQFTPGATATQWRFSSVAGGFLLNSIVVLHYIVMDIPQ